MQTNSQLKIFAYFLGVFILLPLISPLLAHLGFNQLSYWINFLYQWTCHERPWRSYHLFDLQMSYCAREVGTFAGLFISSVLVLNNGNIKLHTKALFIIFIIGILPISADGVIQLVSEIYMENTNELLPIYESVNSIRSLTGLLFGTSIGFIIFPLLQNNYDTISYKISWVKSYFYSIIIGFLFITLIIFISYLTSSKYKPSNPFYDVTVKLPGYNYEIVLNGGHTTDSSFRFFKDNIYTYCRRAKVFMKNESILKCPV